VSLPDHPVRRDRPTPRQKPVVAVFTPAGGPRPPGLEPVAKVARIRYAASPQALAEALKDAEVLLVFDFRSTALRDAWPRAERLRWIHVAAAGVDTVLFPELVSSSVVLTNSRGVFDQAIAEYVLGLMLAFAKDFPATLDLQRRHVWRHRETEQVRGQTVVVVGAGGIGRAIGRLAGSAQMRVVGVARTARASDPDLGRVVAVRDLATVLGDADFVVIAAPLTSETRGLFDTAAFDRMKPTARLINVGRGPIVDEAALLEALQTRRIAGAALDVFLQEPLPEDHPFWDLPGLIVSPHMSGDFVGWMPALSRLFVENHLRWRRGDPLLNVVDKALGYVPFRPCGPPSAGGVKDVPLRNSKSTAT
jgi:phosphoglycerate dehydrogenase-like enzyme